MKKRITGMLSLLLMSAACAMAQNKYDNGELAYRMDMAYRRLTTAVYNPVFSEKFILADVNIQPGYLRRFYNFSGDLSGRYLEVLSLTGKENIRANIRRLARDIIKYQQPDGRFGDSRLNFTDAQIGKQHMALLWGNGRLLIGLLTYFNSYHDQEALAAAKKLGDFYLSVYKACATPAVVKRLDGLGATGIICLTQFTEGLVMLSQATGDGRYADQAAVAYQLLPVRGKQHSHGYLATLRGVLKLYEYRRHAEDLSYVEKAYRDLVSSADYTMFGSVREYFGREAVERDEGCSTADFVRLSFVLNRITGKKDYLDKGELALYNSLFFNQYYTGDFGHHIITENGSQSDYLHAAWWCCTMHGLRAMYDVQQNFILNADSSGVKVNLYLQGKYESKAVGLTIRKLKNKGGTSLYQFKIIHADKPLLFRVPDWSSGIYCIVNGKKQVFGNHDGFLSLKIPVRAGAELKIGFRLKKTIVDASGTAIPLSEIKAPVKGVLHYGPYILGVDDKIDPAFTAEPNDNILYLRTIRPLGFNDHHNMQNISFLPDAYLKVNYQHGGYPSVYHTVLRPISELSFDRRGYLLINMTYSPDNHSLMCNTRMPCNFHGQTTKQITYMNTKISLLIFSLLYISGRAVAQVDTLKDRHLSIPTVDLSADISRQVVVESGTPEIYQGHPTTVLMPDGKTIFCVWTHGHGGSCGPMKRSDDGGKTWSPLLSTPENWTKVYNAPAIYRLPDPEGHYRLFVFAAHGPDGKMNEAYSEDEGRTWSPMKSIGLTTIVPFFSVVPVDGGKKLLAQANIKASGAKDEKENLIGQSISTDGGFTWSPWEIVLKIPGLSPSEPGIIRSPDGKQLLCLLRENARKLGALYMTSNDEGKHWSAAKETIPGLYGDRHQPRYAKDGRLVITFRDVGPLSPTKDHFVAWVGTYDDIVNGRQGQYRIELLHSYNSLDCGYSGLEELPDGTFVATTYIKYRPGADKNSIVSVRFKLAETDKMVKKIKVK